MRPAPRRLAALIIFPAVLLAACGGSGSSGAKDTASASASAGSTVKATTKSGLVVTGGLGEKPTVTIPATAEPKALVTETLVEGKGAAVKKGDTLVANYLGQTWKPKDGKPNVFDNSWDRGQPIGFQIGTGKVIKGWDDGLVGQKIGSRVVLSIPAEMAYGATTSGGQPAGALVFVVDVLGTTSATAAASGTAVKDVPAGYPKIESVPGKEPKIVSLTGVKAPAKAAANNSTLLIKGDGAPIDPKKTLAVQIVQTDVATGKQTTKTWGDGGGPQIVPAEQVLATIPALKGANLGSRALFVTAPSDQGGSLAVIVDIVGQF